MIPIYNTTVLYDISTILQIGNEEKEFLTLTNADRFTDVEYCRWNTVHLHINMCYCVHIPTSFYYTISLFKLLYIVLCTGHGTENSNAPTCLIVQQ